MADEQDAILVLQAKREQMKAACAGIGEPCVELPVSEIKAYKDDEGNWHTLISMYSLICVIDRLLLRSGA